MDDFLLRLGWDEDNEDDEDEMELVGALISTVIIGAERSRQMRVRRRHTSRFYICRQQLLQDPRGDTPWQRLKRTQSDRAYITTMGFDVETFRVILTSGFGQRWYDTPIPREDTHAAGESRPHRRSLDAEDALGLVLHYLNSTIREISLQEIFAIIPSTVSRYITFGLNILLATLRSMPAASISWPKGHHEFHELNKLIRARHERLTGAFGSIDGLKLPVQTASDIDIENATFNGWLQEHFISSVLVFSPKGCIIAANLNAPGSWHDSRVAQPIYEKLRKDTPAGFYLVADTAFPRGTNAVGVHICAPISSGQRLRGTEEQIEEQMAFDRQLLSFRQTAEWGNRALQGSFGRLRVPLEIKGADRRGDLLETCVRAHNLRTNRVGINQIRTVYMPRWQTYREDEAVWKDFENMIFADQRNNDRVTRFHYLADVEDF